MTKYTEALRLLEELAAGVETLLDASDDRYERARCRDNLKSMTNIARTFLADSESSCDAEKAVLVNVLNVAKAHCDELRDAWERGALDSHDSSGGTRSNRNVSVILAIQDALTDTSPAAAALLAQGKALKAAWPYLWHTMDCMSLDDQVAPRHPCDCGFTKMIELVKEARGQVCP